MADLTETLKREHRQIQELLNEVKAVGVTTATGQDRLRKARNLLVAHLRKEDEQLYPRLRKLDGGARLAADFADEMTKVSKDVVAFFDKYENGGDPFEFAADFGKVLGALNSRIRREEISLYPKYDELTGALPQAAPAG